MEDLKSKYERLKGVITMEDRRRVELTIRVLEQGGGDVADVWEAEQILAGYDIYRSQLDGYGMRKHRKLTKGL